MPSEEKKLNTLRWLFLRRPPAFLDAIRVLFEKPGKLIKPLVKNNQVVADLGCGSGFYTFALADLVGSDGKVYAVDLGETSIRILKKRAEKRKYQNVEAHNASAADVSFVPDNSVDFVFANGLL